MIIHSGLFVIALGFFGFFSSKSFHRYISLPITLLLLILALFVRSILISNSKTVADACERQIQILQESLGALLMDKFKFLTDQVLE